VIILFVFYKVLYSLDVTHTVSVFVEVAHFYRNYYGLSCSRLGQSPKVNSWELLWQNFLILTFGRQNLEKNRELWIQRITFAETNLADTHAHSVTDGRRVTQYLLCSLSDGKGKKFFY